MPDGQLTQARPSAFEESIFETPVGPLIARAGEDGLTHVLFLRRAKSANASDGDNTARRHLRAIEKQLLEYFDGRRKTFDVPLRPQGPAFYMRVWNELGGIAYGETISYGELARRIGDPTAARAVGTANGANPIAIVIPCHRVIGADGKLVGYGGGLWRKQTLLDLESGRLPLVRV